MIIEMLKFKLRNIRCFLPIEKTSFSRWLNTVIWWKKTSLRIQNVLKNLQGNSTVKSRYLSLIFLIQTQSYRHKCFWSPQRQNEADAPENINKIHKIDLSNRKLKVRDITDIIKISIDYVYHILQEYWVCESSVRIGYLVCSQRLADWKQYPVEYL